MRVQSVGVERGLGSIQNERVWLGEAFLEYFVSKRIDLQHKWIQKNDHIGVKSNTKKPVGTSIKRMGKSTGKRKMDKAFRSRQSHKEFISIDDSRLFLVR